MLGVWIAWVGAALASEAVQERLDEARRRLELGDYPGARLVIDELDVQDIPPAQQGEARYLHAVSWSMEHAIQPALTELSLLEAELPDHPRVRDARMWRALTLADADQPAAALTVLDSIGSRGSIKRADPTGVDLAKVELCRATWRWEVEADAQAPEGRMKRARRSLDRALDAPAAQELPWFRAAARYAVLHDRIERSVTLDFRDPAGAGRDLAERNRLVTEAEAELKAIVDIRETWFVLRGLLDVGRSYEDLADDLLAAPPPAGLTEEALAEYRRVIGQKALDMVVKAVQYHGLGVDHALRTRWEGPEASALKQALAAATARVDALVAARAAAP